MQIPEFITFFETTRPTSQPVSIYHGACADLVAVIQTNGDTIDESTLANYDATALFEVLGDSDDEDVIEEEIEQIVSDENGDIAVIGPAPKGPKQYFQVPVEIRGNTCVVKWQGNLDTGANAIKIYLRLSKTDEPTNVSYPATWTVRFQESPGFNPSMLEPIPEEIDFDLVKYVNAPWVEISAFNNSVESINETISDVSATTSTLASDVLELSTDVSNLSTLQSNINSDIAEVRQDVVNVQSDVLSLSNELNDKADLSDVIPASSLIVLQEPDYIDTYEPVYKGEYPLHLEMNKNPDDEWAPYDYIQIDPVFGIRASNQYNEMFDLSYYGLSISESDGHYSNVTGHTVEFSYSGSDEQTTLTISQDGLEKTLYNYMTGDYTTSTIEWPDESGKLALQADVDNNTFVITNLVNSANNAMTWPDTFTDANDLADYVKTFIAAIIGQ